MFTMEANKPFIEDTRYEKTKYAQCKDLVIKYSFNCERTVRPISRVNTVPTTPTILAYQGKYFRYVRKMQSSSFFCLVSRLKFTKAVHNKKTMGLAYKSNYPCPQNV